jgi:hypothetical protein
MKLLLCLPQGGLNNQLIVINKCFEYCRKHGRLLLVWTPRSSYGINMIDFLYYAKHMKYVICDKDIITTIINRKNYTVYPQCVKDNMTEFECYYANGVYIEKKTNTPFKMYTKDYHEDILVYIGCGKNALPPLVTLYCLKYKNTVIDYCNKKLDLIPKPFISIQIRNTDRFADYKSLYKNYKHLIDSNDNIYIASDDKKCVDFFMSKKKMYNFTTFPNTPYFNLHYNKDISGDIKCRDVLCDIFMLASSKYIISNSEGGFIKLCRFYNKNRRWFFNIIN